MKQHEEWLLKALNDLASARKLLAGEDPIFDTAAYHTQQCRRKLLRVFWHIATGLYVKATI